VGAVVEEPADRYVRVTAQEAAAAVAGRVCQACRGPKSPGFAFCRTDHLALTALDRAQVARPQADGFVDAYNAALLHLRAHPVRQKQLAPRGGWAFASPIELAAAGFVFLDEAHCRVPRCGRLVWWFRSPDGKRVAVNAGHRQDPKPHDWQPHRASCPDPGYFERTQARRAERRTGKPRRRALQTSARGAR